MMLSLNKCYFVVAAFIALVSTFVAGFSLSTRLRAHRSTVSGCVLEYSLQSEVVEGLLTSQPSIPLKQLKEERNKEAIVKSPNLDESSTPKMVPWATDPLLFVSSEPVLTDEECNTLLEWCKSAGPNLVSALQAEKLDESKDEPATVGAKLLWRLQHWVHDELLGYSDEEECVVPRFVYYPDRDNVRTELDGPVLNTTILLPDGLHVDTNGNQQFRHWTILVYLTSNPNSGATTFPLATPYPPVRGIPTDSEPLQTAKSSAHDMIYRKNRQHTREVETGEAFDGANTLEEAALRLWQRSNKLHTKKDSCETGVRVLPRRGFVTIFSGVNHDGYPNPVSFHGGECLFHGDGDKALLSFFYEVPLSSFSNRAEFGEQIKDRERHFLERHFGALGTRGR